MCACMSYICVTNMKFHEMVHVVRGLLKEENTQATPIVAHYRRTKSDNHA